jgi:hypothetical protein
MDIKTDGMLAKSIASFLELTRPDTTLSEINTKKKEHLFVLEIAELSRAYRVCSKVPISTGWLNFWRIKKLFPHKRSFERVKPNFYNNITCDSLLEYIGRVHGITREDAVELYDIYWGT